MKRMLFLITCIAVLECAHTFRAKMRDDSEADEIRVKCKAELDSDEAFRGPLTMQMTLETIVVSEVAKATWRSASPYRGLEYPPIVKEGAVCDVGYCIKYTHLALFRWAGTFVCSVNDNGITVQDSIIVAVDGLLLLTHCDHFGFLFS